MADFNEGFALRDQAAAAARARIETDMACADPALRPALHYLLRHLFDPQLDMAELARRGKLRGGRSSARWKALTGMTVRAYVRRLRVRTGAALLIATALPNERIAELVGYDEDTTFYRAFRRLFGTTPAAYRAAHAHEAAESVGRLTLDTEAPKWLEALDSWSLAEAASRDESWFDQDELAKSAQSRAELAWGVARGLSAESRDHLVAHVGTTTPALAGLLMGRSRTEGRGNREWGIEVAELALHAIPAHTNPAWSARALAEARVRAHTWIGIAHRLALDFTAAEAAFAQARELEVEGGDEVGDSARSELALSQAALCWVRSDFEPALAMAEESVALARAVDDSEQLIAALRLRAAIHGCMDHPRISMRDLEEALGMLGPDAESAEVGWIRIALINRAIELKDLEGAERRFATAERTISRLSNEALHAQLRFVAGRLAWARRDHERADTLLREAVESFEALDARFQVVAALTDLTMVQLERGRDQEALANARLLLPALRFMRADSEWQDLMRALRQAIQRQAVRVELMREVKARLRRMVAERYDP